MFRRLILIFLLFFLFNSFIVNSEILAIPRCNLNVVKEYSFNEADYFTEPNHNNGLHTLANPVDGSLKFDTVSKVDNRIWEFTKYYYKTDTQSWVLEQKNNLFDSPILPPQQPADFSYYYDFSPSNNVACAREGDPNGPAGPKGRIFAQSLTGVDSVFAIDEVTKAFCRDTYGSSPLLFSESGALLNQDFPEGTYKMVLRNTAGNISTIQAFPGDFSLIPQAISESGNLVIFYRSRKKSLIGPYIFNTANGIIEKLNFGKDKYVDLTFINDEHIMAGHAFLKGLKVLPFIANNHSTRTLSTPIKNPSGYIRQETKIINRLSDGRWIVETLPYRTKSPSYPGRLSYFLFDEKTNKYCELTNYLPNYHKGVGGYTFLPASNGNLIISYNTKLKVGITHVFYRAVP